METVGVLLRLLFMQPARCWWLWALVVLLLFVLGAGVVRTGLGWGRARKRSAGHDRTPHCLCCGYNLTGLDIPRCPECGVLRGFQVALTDLGLSEAELRALAANKCAGTPIGPPNEHFSGPDPPLSAVQVTPSERRS